MQAVPNQKSLQDPQQYSCFRLLAIGGAATPHLPGPDFTLTLFLMLLPLPVAELLFQLPSYWAESQSIAEKYGMNRDDALQSQFSWGVFFRQGEVSLFAMTSSSQNLGANWRC